jgi:FemAB family protein
LISAGLRSWDVFVLSELNANPKDWLEFKRLHCEVAGRATRCDETWAKQYEMVVGGKGFLVGLRDTVHGRLIGAGFFQTTRDEGLYSVGAYDRTLFDKPLGHVVQQVAIQVMKERGLRWYCVGERHYRQDSPMPTEKAISIATFKQGFASHLFCRFQFELPLDAASRGWNKL